MSAAPRRSPRSCTSLVLLAEYLHCLPGEVRRQVRDALYKSDTNADEWPAVPYGYWMGRIKAYEDWLASLDERTRTIEIRRAEDRTERYYEKKLERAPLAFARVIASSSKSRQRALLDQFQANRAPLCRRRGLPELTRPMAFAPARSRAREHGR